MPTFLVISRHTPESCSIHNEKNAKTALDWFSKREDLEAKHGVKMVGGWNVHPEHLTVQVFEAPSYEAMDAYGMEPEVANIATWNTMEFKVATTLDDVYRMHQQVWQK